MTESPKTYTEKDIEDTKERMRELFEGEFSGMRSEISRLNKKLNVELRTNAQSGDIFAAIHQFTETAAHMAVNLALKWFKDFGDMEHFGEHYYTPSRNWPLIISLVALGVTGVFLVNPGTRMQFIDWYSVYPNSYILGVLILAGVIGYFLWRRRGVKTTQTQV